MSSNRMVVSGKVKTTAAVVDESGRWEELSPEILALIFVRIPAHELVRNVPLVCKPWMVAVSDSSCWRDIDVSEWSHRRGDSRAVDLAVGKLVGWSNCTFQRLSVYLLGNSGFEFIANRAMCLTVLQIPMSEITDDMVLKHVKSMANVRVLDISECSKITVKGVEAFGIECKGLVSLKRNMSTQWMWDDLGDLIPPIDDSEATAIANSMSNLQYLEVCNGCFGDDGLSEILAKCKSLTRLGIHGCWNVHMELERDLESLQKLECFGSPFNDEFYDTGEDSLG